MKEIRRSMDAQLAPWRNQTLISVWQHMHAKRCRRAARIHLPAAAQLFILPRLPEGSVSSHILYRGAPSLAVCPSVHLCLPCGLGMAWQRLVKLFTCCCVVSVSLLNINQKGPRHVCLEQHCGKHLAELMLSELSRPPRMSSSKHNFCIFLWHRGCYNGGPDNALCSVFGNYGIFFCSMCISCVNVASIPQLWMEEEFWTETKSAGITHCRLKRISYQYPQENTEHILHFICLPESAFRWSYFCPKISV